MIKMPPQARDSVRERQLERAKRRLVSLSRRLGIPLSGPAPRTMAEIEQARLALLEKSKREKTGRAPTKTAALGAPGPELSPGALISRELSAASEQAPPESRLPPEGLKALQAMFDRGQISLSQAIQVLQAGHGEHALRRAAEQLWWHAFGEHKPHPSTIPLVGVLANIRTAEMHIDRAGRTHELPEHLKGPALPPTAPPTPTTIPTKPSAAGAAPGAAAGAHGSRVDASVSKDEQDLLSSLELVMRGLSETQRISFVENVLRLHRTGQSVTKFAGGTAKNMFQRITEAAKDLPALVELPPREAGAPPGAPTASAPTPGAAPAASEREMLFNQIRDFQAAKGKPLRSDQIRELIAATPDELRKIVSGLKIKPAAAPKTQDAAPARRVPSEHEVLFTQIRNYWIDQGRPLNGKELGGLASATIEQLRETARQLEIPPLSPTARPPSTVLPPGLTPGVASPAVPGEGKAGQSAALLPPKFPPIPGPNYGKLAYRLVQEGVVSAQQINAWREQGAEVFERNITDAANQSSMLKPPTIPQISHPAPSGWFERRASKRLATQVANLMRQLGRTPPAQEDLANIAPQNLEAMLIDLALGKPVALPTPARLSSKDAGTRTTEPRPPQPPHQAAEEAAHKAALIKEITRISKPAGVAFSKQALSSMTRAQLVHEVRGLETRMEFLGHLQKFGVRPPAEMPVPETLELYNDELRAGQLPAELAKLSAVREKASLVAKQVKLLAQLEPGLSSEDRARFQQQLGRAPLDYLRETTAQMSKELSQAPRVRASPAQAPAKVPGAAPGAKVPPGAKVLPGTVQKPGWFSFRRAGAPPTAQRPPAPQINDSLFPAQAELRGLFASPELKRLVMEKEAAKALKSEQAARRLLIGIAQQRAFAARGEEIPGSTLEKLSSRNIAELIRFSEDEINRSGVEHTRPEVVPQSWRERLSERRKKPLQGRRK